jgi:hypothetical protein
MEIGNNQICFWSLSTLGTKRNHPFSSIFFVAGAGEWSAVRLHARDLMARYPALHTSLPELQ